MWRTYPYYASMQSGPYASIYPSLEYIAAKDNSEQGARYGNFIVACKLSTGDPFLVVPLAPALGIPTARLCNP